MIFALRAECKKIQRLKGRRVYSALRSRFDFEQLCAVMNENVKKKHVCFRRGREINTTCARCGISKKCGKQRVSHRIIWRCDIAHTLQNNEEPASQQRLTPLSVSTPHQHKGRKTCAPTRVFNLLAADNAYCHYIERTYNARVAAAAAH
jgi:hypothetical protein